MGQKEPNQFGLYDMHGNISEWCEDVYDPVFYSTPEATRKDPVCPDGTENRMERGGSWLRSARECRSASRDGAADPSGFWLFEYGLRPAAPSP